jgi:hypothetical protein
MHECETQWPPTWSVVISARPGSPGRATTNIGLPGSFALSGTRSQFAPPSPLCSRMAGLPTIQPSGPLKLMLLKR